MINDLIYKELRMEDIEKILPLYIDYYNNCEESCWTCETAHKRIHQVLSMEGAYGLLLEEEENTIGFAMGYFQQYDDIQSYVLEEILIAREHQGKGLGTAFLEEIEKRVKALGAACVELKAVNDEMHEHYYTKAGFHPVKNFVLKVKWF
ncbi:MAG: GNAT family N-acetyltransferase [Lachnospiraceae bacterium]|nr:GNAT family N-acetyltransferase [Lachnospiraceae bacterium]